MLMMYDMRVVESLDNIPRWTGATTRA
jgi:hypothetical protein